MAKKLFVGNLPYTATSDELKELFSQVGAVETATVVTDKFTGRSRGFGFVEMGNDDEANKAIETLNGQDLGGRNIMVNEARPREERPAGGGDRRGGFRSDRPRRNEY